MSKYKILIKLFVLIATDVSVDTSHFYLKLGILYICNLNYFDVLSNTSFKEHLPEDGHNR